ncbi:hypothetical protein E2C01_067072 [Portunus trituberculatus]|uniref:Uncharacterized protein n=1 Tax=Portunus trituberculatus TaxID=210409 RepID=A0A5B7HSL7_PORTR|nr:hypothetical protein [Portunus trituberculatus]
MTTELFAVRSAAPAVAAEDYHSVGYVVFPTPHPPFPSSPIPLQHNDDYSCARCRLHTCPHPHLYPPTL